MSDDELIRQALAELYPPGPKRDRWLAFFRAMSEAQRPLGVTHWRRRGVRIKSRSKRARRRRSI